MFSFFRGGKKKTPLKLSPRQEVEIEFEGESATHEQHFAQVSEVQKKKVVVKVVGNERKPLQIGVSQKVTLSVLTDNSHLSCELSVLDIGDGSLELSWPPKDHDEQALPPRDDSFQVKVPIPVEFRALKTAHTQMASTYAVTTNGLYLATNLAIPPSTSLLMELKIPGGSEITAKGRSLSSRDDTSTGRKRSITEIEYEDIAPEDCQKVIQFALFYQQRMARLERRGG